VTEKAEQPGFEPVLIGRITGLFGVRGWVRVFSFTDPREAVLGYGPWWVQHDGAWRPMPLAEGRRHGKGVIARLESVSDRDQAAALQGSDIAVAPEARPQPEDGRYYWRDLEGLEVRHRDGTSLGRVAYVMETGANAVLVVEGERERLIPFLQGSVILDVDLASATIHVDWEWD
jgi:16S rRNA processing protein RimM